MLGGPGAGIPFFVSSQATESKSEPLPAKSNSRIPMPLDNYLSSGFFDSKPWQARKPKKGSEPRRFRSPRIKSEPLPGKSRGFPLTTTASSKPCFICGSLDWWWRQSSPLGGPGEFVCSVCHPNPNCHVDMATSNHNTPGAGETFGIISAPGGRR